MSSRSSVILGLSLLVSLNAGAQSGRSPSAASVTLRVQQSLDADWSFHRGDVPDAEQPGLTTARGGGSMCLTTGDGYAYRDHGWVGGWEGDG